MVKEMLCRVGLALAIMSVLASLFVFQVSDSIVFGIFLMISGIFVLIGCIKGLQQTVQ